MADTTYAFTAQQIIDLGLENDYKDLWYDLSDYDAFIEWSKVEAPNVIIKIGGSLWESKLGLKHAIAAHQAGKRVCLYYWNDPLHDPIKQADHFLSLAQKVIDAGVPVYGLFVDVEQWWSNWDLWRQYKGVFTDTRIPHLTDSQISENGRRMVESIEARTSITVGVYTGNWFVVGCAPSMKKWIVNHYIWVSYYWYSGDRRDTTWKDLCSYFQPGIDRLPIRWSWIPLDKLILWQWTGDVFQPQGTWSIAYTRKKPVDVSCYRGQKPASVIFKYPVIAPPIPTPEDPGGLPVMTPLKVIAKELSVSNVPYVPQLGTGADEHNKDCGAAAGLMLVEGYTGKTLTVNEFYNKSGVIYDQYLTFTQIRDVIKSFGINTNYEAGVKIGRLYEILSANIPVIALIKYSVLVDAGLTQRKDFLGAHFVVVTGFNADKIFIHDPYTSDLSGSFKSIPAKIFFDAWKAYQATPTVAPWNALIAPVYPIGDPNAVNASIKSYIVTSVNGLNIRKIPGVITSANWIGSLAYNDKVEIETTKLIGATMWGKLAGREAWVSMDYLRVI